MSAPNFPVAIGGSVNSSMAATNASYKGMACSGRAARMKLGRVPFLVEACKVNWLTINTSPEMSIRDSFILPSASVKIRIPAILLASQLTSSGLSASSMPTRTIKPRLIFPQMMLSMETEASDTL